MSDRRIEIIIKEIHYWKQHKLLPDTYCDFLLALYTKGEGQDNNVTMEDKGFNVRSIIQLLLQLVSLLLSMVIIYGIEVQPFIKIGLLIPFLLLSFWMYFLQKRGTYSRLSIIIVLMLLLIISVYVSKLFITNPWLTNVIFLLNFVGWLQISRKLSYKYLKLISIMSILFTLIYIIFQLFIS